MDKKPSMKKDGIISRGWIRKDTFFFEKLDDGSVKNSHSKLLD